MNFHPIDWIIVIVYLAATMAAGLYGKRYVMGIGDYLVAGRKLGTFIGVATLAATEIGTITFMYNAQLGFTAGFSSFISSQSLLIASPLKYDPLTGVVSE